MVSLHALLRAVVETLVVAVTLVPAAAQAATVTVNTTTPDNPTDGRCGLIEAVTAVNQAATFRNCTYTPNSQSDRIVVSTGTHTLQSELILSRPVEIVGTSQSDTIINSGGVSVIRFDGQNVGNSTLVLKTITIQKLSTQSAPVIGVRVDSSDPSYLVMDHVRVRNCSGSGVLLRGALVTADIRDSVLENNRGGIWAQDATLYVTNSTIRNNVSNGLQITVTESVSSEWPIAYIQNSTISGNQTQGDGGGIYTNANIDIYESVLANNTATAGGGGLYVSNSHTRTQAYVYGSAFRNNRAAKGAGIHLAGDGPTTSLMVYESSLTDNVATGDGGAIYTSGQIDQGQNVTIHNNRAARGGALFHEKFGELHLLHLTVTQNRATQAGGGGGFWLSPSNHAFAFNILSDNRAGSGFTPPINNLITSNGAALQAAYCLVDNRAGSSAFPIASEGGTNIVGAPGLGTLTTPSGQVTALRPLQTGSRAIDAIPAESGDTVTTDQLGLPRPIDRDFDGLLEKDIGAIEAR